MYTRENSRPLVECSVRRLTRSGATSIPSDVESATRSNRRSILSLSVPPLHVVERGSGGEAHVVERGLGGEAGSAGEGSRSEEHTSELQSHSDLVCRLLLEKKKKT